MASGHPPADQHSYNTDPFKTALVDVAKELTEKEVKELAFECPFITRSDRDTIDDGVKLLDTMTTNRFVTKNNVDSLIELLSRRHLNEAVLILKTYREEFIAITSQESPRVIDYTTPSTSSTFQPSIPRPSSKVYPMGSIPRGKCLLLMHDEYDSGHSFRNGNAMDMKKLKKLFEEVLQFDVILRYNKTLKETEAIIKEIRELKDHGDCFLCFVCSHGNGKAFLTRDGEWLEFQKLYENFTADNCKALQGKPKVFFMNACLKEETGTQFQEFVMSDSNVCSDGQESRGIGAKESKLSPKEAHFCISYSTIAGYSSARDPKDGTFFVQNIYKVFNENYKRDHLLDLLTEVRKSMNEQLLGISETFGKCQVSPDFNTLYRKLYFHNQDNE